MKKETNYEHYKDEIIKTLIQEGSCGFIKEYVLKPGECNNDLSCSECDTKVEKWFNAPYEDSKIEIDWEKVPNNTPVYVSNETIHPTNTNIPRHFSAYVKDSTFPFKVWTEGKTSFTTPNTFVFRYCSLARKEDIEKYKKV